MTVSERVVGRCGRLDFGVGTARGFVYVFVQSAYSRSGLGRRHFGLRSCCGLQADGAGRTVGSMLVLEVVAFLRSRLRPKRADLKRLRRFVTREVLPAADESIVDLMGP